MSSVRGINFEKPVKPTRCNVCYATCSTNEEMLKQFCTCGCDVAVFTCLDCPVTEACLCFDAKRKCEKVEEKQKN